MKRRAVQREIMALKKINHPNIVDIVEVYEYDGAQLIIFEIMNGGEVNKKLKLF